MKEKKVILDEKSVERSLIRIAHEIIEKNKGVENLVLVGIKRRGVPLAHRTAKNIESIEGVTVETVSLDITSYRDDLELQDKPGISSPLDIKCDITDKSIILFDDVLYTGRTVRAALDALIDIGRPRSIQLAVLIDRGHRELPIRPDYVGKNVPTSREEIVKVNLFEIDGNNEVVIYKK